MSLSGPFRSGDPSGPVLVQIQSLHACAFMRECRCSVVLWLVVPRNPEDKFRHVYFCYVEGALEMVCRIFGEYVWGMPGACGCMSVRSMNASWRHA